MWGVPLLLLLVLGGGAVAFWKMQSRALQAAEIARGRAELQQLWATIQVGGADQGELASRLREVSRHVGAASDPYSMLTQALLHHALGDPGRALDLLQRVELQGQELGTEADALRLRVTGEANERLYFVGGRELNGRSALHAFRTLADRSGEGLDQYRAYRMAQRLGDEATASTMKAAIQKAGGDHSRRIEVTELVEQGQYDQALLICGELGAEFDSEPEIHLETAQCLLQGSRAQEPDSLTSARRSVDRALQLNGFSIEARSTAAAVYHLLRDQKTRNVHLQWLLDRAPSHTLASQWRAMHAAPIPDK
jgi:hypothetical protein